MRQLALRKKESRLLWQVLVRGLVATDRLNGSLSEDDRDDYLRLRRKVVAAWKGGIIVGGVRPKKELAAIMPERMLQEAHLPALKKSLKKAGAEAKNHLVAPHKTKDRA